ncbi:MAG: ATP-binding protein [Acidobacteriota bacterium]|nr:MAG: PAS domain S-box protein [Acidobacteriota bacterium]
MSELLHRPFVTLNAARILAVSALLLATFLIEILFSPERPLTPLYTLSAVVYGAVLVYVLLERWLGDSALLAMIQIGTDILIVAGFVMATGGILSPVSFLFVVPVMIAAAIFGLRGGLIGAVAAWMAYGSLLAVDLWRVGAGATDPGRALYAALSHLVGFLALGALGGLLADRLQLASEELGRREVDLRELEALHAEIVESINTGLLTTDEDGTVTFVNRAGREILGLPDGQIVGRPVADVIGLTEETFEDAARSARDGRRSRFERRWRRPRDGEEVLLGFAISRLRDAPSAQTGWLVVFQDLTEIASLEEQVRVRERMAALGEMAAGMAHELRNPLAAISGCVQVLGGETRAETRRELVEVTRRETERLNRIIRDFLEFARPGPFRPRAIDLAGLMQELGRLLEKSPDLGGRHRVAVLAPDGPTFARADPDRMRQVFWNLAGNALKAMPEGGALTIEVRRHAGDQVLVAFRDEGHGMDADAVRRYFQPFSGGFPDGVGLGAAIVYRIAEEHGGDVQVISRPGRGTEIRLLLPRAQAPAGPDARPAGVRAPVEEGR